MSTSLFGKHARDLTLAEAALIAGLVKAPSALSPWSNLDGARRRSDTCSRGCRRPASSRGAGRRGAAAAAAHPAVPGAAPRRATATRRSTCGSSSATAFGGDQPPDWEVHTTVLPALQDTAEQSVANGLAPARHSGPAGGARRARSRHGPRPGHRRRTRLQRRRTFNRAVAQPAPAGIGVQAVRLRRRRCERGMTPVTVLTGSTALAPQGQRGVDAAQRVRADRGPADAAPGVHRVEQPRRRRAAAADRHAARAAARLVARAMPDQPDVPSLALGSGLVTPLRADRRVRGVSQTAATPWRRTAILRVVDDAGGVVLEESDDAAACHARGRRVSGRLADERRHRPRHRHRGARVGRPISGGGEDRHDQRLQGRLVRRLLRNTVVAGVWVGFDQPATIREGASGSRVALPIWAEFMRRASRLVRPGAFAPPDGMRAVELCRISYLRPVDGCPVYTEYFKAGDDVPSAHCQIHGGNLRAEGGTRDRTCRRWPARQAVVKDQGTVTGAARWREGGTASRSSRSRTICAPPASGVEQRPRRRDPARRAMELARARVAADLAKATQPAHRQMLEAALADLDRSLRREGPA